MKDRDREIRMSVEGEYRGRKGKRLKRRRRLASLPEEPPASLVPAPLPKRQPGEEVVQERSESPKKKGSVIVQPVEVTPPKVRERKMTLWKLYRPSEEVKMHLVQIIGLGFEGNVLETTFIRTTRPVHLMRMTEGD